jgi:hypothetical protein
LGRNEQGEEEEQESKEWAKGVRRKGSGGKEGRSNWEGRRAIGKGGGIKEEE